MRIYDRFELPPDKAALHRRAIRLEWWTVVFFLSTVALLAATLGQSQAMKAAWVEVFSDAEMNRADWLTAAAAVLGVAGIGAGLWWADAVAALVIGGDIVRDGVRTTRAAVANLMDNRPRVVDGSHEHPLPRALQSAVLDVGWVADAEVRLREEGHVFVGELLVVPRAGTDRLVERCEELEKFARDFDWRVHDLVVAPLSSIRS